MLFSHSVVEHVLKYQQTVFDSSINLSAAASLSNVSAFVGSPIMDERRCVIACLFGVRRLDDELASTGVLPIEAQLVQVIAGIVSTRISRLAAEAEQIRTQVQLEQFASTALVREMQSNPQWLEATERELTLMFGDIRNFSTISERLTAHETFSLVREVMDCVTEVIHRHGGFIFNYAGDGIAAMWNAPEPNEAHAFNSARAAMEIQERLPVALQTWTKLVGQPVRIGLGIHTGNALIGNSGSKHRLKYSPLGHAVNLASRVEGATKYLGVSILITQAMRDRIGVDIPTRNFGEISVVGIRSGVRVYQLAPESQIDRDLWERYEQALRLYEKGDLPAARIHAERVLADHLDDIPTKILLDRIEQSNGLPSPWTLPSK